MADTSISRAPAHRLRRPVSVGSLFPGQPRLGAARHGCMTDLCALPWRGRSRNTPLGRVGGGHQRHRCGGWASWITRRRPSSWPALAEVRPGRGCRTHSGTPAVWPPTLWQGCFSNQHSSSLRRAMRGMTTPMVPAAIRECRLPAQQLCGPVRPSHPAVRLACRSPADPAGARCGAPPLLHTSSATRWSTSGPTIPRLLIACSTAQRTCGSPSSNRSTTRASSCGS